jgi:hypothetical protein
MKTPLNRKYLWAYPHICDHVEYLIIDCGKDDCSILYTLWGGTVGYRNLRQNQLWGGKGDSEVYNNNNCGVVQEGINWSFVFPYYKILIVPSDKRQSGWLNHKLESIKKIVAQQGLNAGWVNTKFIRWKAVCCIAGMPTCRHAFCISATVS